jgi:hypothetical protein
MIIFIYFTIFIFFIHRNSTKIYAMRTS